MASNNKHEEYVDKILKIGKALGYQTSRRFSKDPQGDAIWFAEINKGVYSNGKLPIVAFEVLCSETPKLIKGSIATLQHISSSLGVLVIIDEEYARNSKNYGYDEITYPEYIKRKSKQYSMGVKLTSRIEVWDQNKINILFHQIVEE